MQIKQIIKSFSHSHLSLKQEKCMNKFLVHLKGQIFITFITSMYLTKRNIKSQNIIFHEDLNKTFSFLDFNLF